MKANQARQYVLFVLLGVAVFLLKPRYHGPLASVWMCTENIMLALAAEGLYGCTYTPYAAKGLKEFLGVPEGFEIAPVIPFGYAKEPPGENEAEDLDARLHIDGWGTTLTS